MSTPDFPGMARTAHWTASVTVRVPCESDRSLADAAARRIEAVSAVELAAVETVSGFTPALSATVVTVRVTVRTADDHSELALESTLQNAPGAKRVQSVTPVD